MQNHTTPKQINTGLAVLSILILFQATGCEMLGLGSNNSPLLTSAPPISDAKIIHVPDDWPTIAAAISNATAGDIVLVDAGTYNETIILKEGVRVVGAGYETTVIDASGIEWAPEDEDTRFAAVVSIPPGRTRATVLEGFTITNRFDGIFSEDSSPIIRDCHITNNQRNNVSIVGGQPLLENNLITGPAQAGIEVWRATGKPTIVNTTIVNHSGPGVCWVQNAKPEVTNAIIANNGQGLLAADRSGIVVLRSSNVFGNDENYSQTSSRTGLSNNISQDPQFVSATNFQLQSSSPSKRTGALTADMGAFGNRPLAWIRSRIADENDAIAGRSDLVLTFDIPSNHPDFAFLGNRAHTFDNALTVILCSLEGDFVIAKRILARLASLQNPVDGSIDGSFNTKDDFKDGLQFSGNVAWAGYAFTIYQRMSGDAEFQENAERFADHLLSLQDNRPGSPSFGSIRRAANGADLYITEHNVHAAFFFEELFALTTNNVYRDAAQRIRDSLENNHFNVDHFITSIGNTELASDSNALGALAMHAMGKDAEAQSALWFNDLVSNFGNAQTAPNGTLIEGHSPRPSPSPRSIWVETTLGAGLAWKRTGNLDRATKIRLDMQSLLSESGGMRSSFPRIKFDGDIIFDNETFTEWPNVAATVWYLLLRGDFPDFYRDVP